MPDNRPEIVVLNKYLKKMFPIIIEVSDYSIDPFIDGNVLTIRFSVSPENFCELFFNENVERKVMKHMRDEASTLLKSIFPEWDGRRNVFFSYNPHRIERSVLKVLNISE